MRAALLERSHGQVREGRDFSAEISHEERRTFKKLVALLRPALERDNCKNSVLAVS